MNTRYTMTLGDLKIQNMLTSLAADSLVKTSALLVKVSELKGLGAAYGLKCSELVGKLDLDTSLLRTAQCCLFEDLRQCYAIFPESGIMQNGNVYQAQTLAYNRVGNDYIVLPTPTKSDKKTSPKNRFFGSLTYRGNLCEYIRDGTDDPTYPNPALSEVLMTFPICWTELQE